MKRACSWGVAVAALVHCGVGLAQVPGPNSAPSGGSGTAGAASTAAPTPAPTDTAPAPVPTPEAPPEAAPPPPPPAAAPAAADEDAADEDAEEAERKKKKKAKKRRRFFDEDRERAEEDHERELEATDEESSEAPAAAPSWRLAGPHFVLSADRMTSILSWSQTLTSEVESFNPINGAPTTETEETTVSGTDVALLGAGGFGENPFATPRIGIDYVFQGGFSLGGTLGYMVTSSKSETPATDGEGTTTTDRPTVDIVVFAPRLGVFLEATPTVAVWLRGGITRLVASSESDSVDDFDGSTTKFSSTLSFWDLTLDPQLVLSPAPHIGITLGVTLDIGLSGTFERKSGSTTRENDVKASSYGVTGGLVAMF